MDNRLKRFLSLALAMVMVIGMMPANIVFATENGGTPDNENILLVDNTEDSSEPEETEHQCAFEETAKVEPTWTTAGSRTLKCACGEEKTERICATGCWMDSHHEGACEILCDQNKYCVLDYGHDGLCYSAGNEALIDLNNIQSEEGLRAALALGDTVSIVLTQNIELNAAVEIGNTVILDMNGKSITVKAGKDIAYALINKGKLTVKGNGSISGIQNEATGDNVGLIIENGTVTATGAATYAVYNLGKATINGGTFNPSTGSSEFAVWNHTLANLTINSGEFTGVYSEGKLDILGGKFNGLPGKNAVWAHGGILNISYGTFQKSESQNNQGIATVKISESCAATITGGSFSNANGLSLELAKSTLTIGGTSVVHDGIKVDADATLNIDGGTFEDPVDNDYKPADGATITVKGGTFVEEHAQAFATRYAAAGKTLKFKTGNVIEDVVKSGDYTVAKVVAKIGEVAYHNLADAIAVGGTIDVVADITVNKTIDVAKDVVLNVGNNTITSNVAYGRIFNLISGCTAFTVNDGTFVSNSPTDYGVIDIKTAAEVIVEGGTYNFNTVDNTLKYGSIFRGRNTGNTTATLKLKDIKVETDYWVFTTGDATENGKLYTLTVEGGEYKSTAGAAFAVNVVDGASFEGTKITAPAMGVEISGCGNTNAEVTFSGKNDISVTGGGTVDGGMDGYVIAFSGGVDVTVDDAEGKYGSENYAGNLIGLTTSGGNLLIEDGIFNGKITSLCQNGLVSITGGTFNGFDGVTANGGQLVISGGNYSKDPSAWLATYYEAIKGTNNRYTVLRKDVHGQKPADLGEVFKGSSVVVDDAKKNEIVDEIIRDINNSTVSNLPDDITTLVITPVKILAETNSDDQIVVSKIVYDVTPVKGTQPLNQLAKPITFRLPIPSHINSYITKANVYHDDETTPTEMELQVDEESASKEKYIEITAKDFSEYTIELFDIDFTHHVAKIGIKGYPSVQAAVNAVQDGQKIELLERTNAMAAGTTYGTVTINLSANKSFVIEGYDYAWAHGGEGPTITINGAASDAQVTIQNVVFSVSNKSSGEMIAINGACKNVLIKDCDFAGPGSSSEMVAIELNNASGVEIDGGTASGLKAYLVNTAGTDLTIKNVTIKDSNVGMELGAVQKVTVDSVAITSTVGKYGISMDASVNNQATFNSCTINALVPIMVYGNPKTTHGRITVSGTNHLGIADSKYWMILTDAKYSEMAATTDVEKLTTTGRIVIDVTDADLDAAGINDKHMDNYDENTRKFYTVAPEGKLNEVLVVDGTAVDDSRISLDIKGLVASERITLEILDAQGNKIAVSKLINTRDYLYSAALTGVVDISNITNDWDANWKTEWVTEHKVPTYKFVPATANLIVDGKKLNENPVPVKMNAAGAAARLWTDIEDVGNMTLTENDKTTWKHSLAEAFNAVVKNGKITLFADNTAELSANGEIVGDKTVTITGTGTLDWGTGWLFVGRGENSSGNGKLIFDKANITAAGTEPSKLGFNVSGMRNQGGTPTSDGNITIKGGSNVEVDYVVNRNVINVTGKGTKLTIRNGIAVGGRPKTEVAGATVDQTAKVNVDGGAILHVKYDNNEGLGEEGIGVLNVKDATFICDDNFHVAEDGSVINVKGTSTLKIKKLIGTAVNMTDGATLVDSSVGGEVVANNTPAGSVNVYFDGVNTISTVRINSSVAHVDGELNAKNLVLNYSKLYTNTESKINFEELTIGDGDLIVIDTTKLADATAVRVINQTAGTTTPIAGRVEVQDSNAKAKPYIVYGEGKDIGDVAASKVDRSTVYFNPAYAWAEDQQLGDKVADGRYQGVNAFDKFKNTSDNKLVLPQETKTVVLAIGNKETASYGKLYSTQNLIVKTEGSGNDKYAVVDMVRNGNGNLTIEKDHKIKVLGGKGNSGADKQGGVFTINGEVLVANGNFKLWRNDDTHLGKLVVGASGNLTLEDGNVDNVGQITINGAGKVDVKNGDVQNGGAIVIDGTGLVNVKNGTIANTGTITMDYTSDVVAKNITGNGTITIDTTGMVAVNKVKVIELSGNATTKALMESSSVKILKDAAAKYVGADGDVYVYYEAFVDKDKDNTLDLNEGYASIEKAIAAATDGQTVVLLADAETASVTIQKSLTLNLNGHKITKTAPLYVDGSQKAVTVTVSNGTITGSGAGIVMRKNATLNVNTGAKIAGEPAIQVYGGNLNVNGGEIVGSTNAISTSFNAAAAYVGNAAVKISSGKVTGKIILEDAKTGYAAPAGYIASLTITGGTFQKNDLDQDYITKNYGSIAVSGGTFDKFVPYEMCAMDYLCQKKANSNLFEVIHSPHRRVYMKNVDDKAAKVTVGGEAYFDGKAYEVMTDKVVLLDLEQAKKPQMFITTYKYAGSGDNSYPEQMYVWYAVGKNPNKNGVYTSYEVTRVAQLDNFFKYHGTSIRVGAATNGIRFLSSVNTSDANKLMNGTLITSATSPLRGAKMTQTGTEFWKTVGKELRSEVYGGAVGKTFRTFQKYQGRDWFTGVLVGLENNAATVKDLIYTRPYAEIQINGKTVTLYGGLLSRSIYYVAKQNQNTFKAGTSYDNFVESLIRAGEKGK